jgi:hypothetical protein
MSRSRAVQTPGGPAPEEATEPVQAAQATETQPEPADGTLRAADVDPTTIKRAVLTADGWVCPAASPAPPARQ